MTSVLGDARACGIGLIPEVSKIWLLPYVNSICDSGEANVPSGMDTWLWKYLDVMSWLSILRLRPVLRYHVERSINLLTLDGLFRLKLGAVITTDGAYFVSTQRL